MHFILIFLLLFFSALAYPAHASRPRARPPPPPGQQVRYMSGSQLDVISTLRFVEDLRRKNASQEADRQMKILRFTHPEFAHRSIAASRAIGEVSLKYHGLGCNLLQTLQSNSSTFFTFRKLDDGLGNVVIQLVKALAFVYHRGWNFLGVVGEVRESLGNREDEALDFYFGDYKPLIIPSLPKENVVRAGKTMKQHSRILRRKSIENTTFYLSANRFELERYISKYESNDIYIMNKTNQYLSADFLGKLRKGASCGVEKALSLITRGEIDKDTPGSLKVVAHIRLGDVLINPKSTYKRTSMRLYLLLFALIREICPFCKFYAFTSVMHKKQLRSIQQHLDKFRKLNVTVYVDYHFGVNATDEALNTIAHFSKADVFITARSEFSLIGAYLNSNCVIYSTYSANFPLKNWIVLPYIEDFPTALKIVKQDLPPCLSSVLQNKRST